MSKFGPAYKAMRLIEGDRHGGYVDDPDDPGGETYAGVSRRFHPKVGIWVIIDAAKAKADFPACLDLPELATQLELAVADFYDSEFWRPGRFESIEDQPLANEVFEQAVNLGLSGAITNLQLSLNALNNLGKRWPDIPADGAPGPSTTAAVAAARVKGMSDDIRKAANVFQGYHYLTSRNERFTRGWLTRVSL